MAFINEYRNLFEFVYFISSSFLLVGVIVGIIQIRLFKSEASQRFYRETLLISLTSIESKLKTLSDLQDSLWEEESEAEIQFEGEVNDLYRGGIQCKNSWLEWIESDDGADVFNKAIPLLNELEILSNYIYSGIADEDFIFRVQGEYLLTFLEQNMHYCAAFRESRDDATYEGIVRLYDEWKNKNERKHLILEQHRIIQKISKIKKPDSVNIIGK